jgi:hypothetical protein
MMQYSKGKKKRAVAGFATSASINPDPCRECVQVTLLLSYDPGSWGSTWSKYMNSMAFIQPVMHSLIAFRDGTYSMPRGLFGLPLASCPVQFLTAGSA